MSGKGKKFFYLILLGTALIIKPDFSVQGAPQEEAKEIEEIDYFQEGVGYYRQDKYALAIEEWEKVSWSDENYKKARKYIKHTKGKIIRLEEERRTGEVKKHLRAGLSSYKEGDYSSAIKEWEEALKLEPKYKYKKKVKKHIKLAREKVKLEEGKERKRVRGYYVRGKDLYRKGNYNEAIAQWKRALDIEPGHKDSLKFIEKAEDRLREKEVAEKGEEIEEYYKKGEEYYRKEDYTSAIKEWEKVLEINPKQRKARRFLRKATKILVAGYDKKGEAYYEEKRYEEAKNEWQKILGLAPENEKALKDIERAKEALVTKYYQEGEVSFADERYKEAIENYKKVLKINPEYEEASLGIKKATEELVTKHYLKGEIYFKNGDYDSALREWEEVVKLDSVHKGAKEGIEKAKLELTKIEHHKGGKTYFEAGEYDKAILEWEKVLKLDSVHKGAKEGIEKAKKELTRLLEEKKRKEKIGKYYTEGETYFGSKKFKEAIAEWEKVLKLDSAHKGAKEGIEKAKKELTRLLEKKEEIGRYYKEGETYFNNQDYEKAVTSWERVLKLDPGHKKAAYGIKTAKEELAGWLEEKKRKEEIEKIYLAGENYFKSKEYEKAILEWEKVLTLDPQQQRAREGIKKAELELKKLEHYKQGEDYFKAGKYREAISEFEKVVELEPANEKVKEAIEKAKKKLAPLYYNQGELFFNQEKYEEALEKWEEVLKINPYHEEVQEGIKKAKERLAVLYYNQGKDFYAAGEYEKAILEWEKVLNMEEGKEVYLSMWDRTLRISVYKKVQEGIKKAEVRLKK